MSVTLELFTPPPLTPPLPSRVPCISLHEPYASLVIAGVKTIETRAWEYPYGPGWLVIHRAKHVDNHALARLSAKALVAEGCTKADIRSGLGVAAGIVYVTDCRRLTPEDAEAACFYAPDRYAWLLEKARRFPRPLAMRGPQKFVYLARETILQCLEAA